MPAKINIDKEILHQKYIIEQKTALQISKELNVSPNTIIRNLKSLNITIRSQIKDLIGKKFNMLTVISYAGIHHSSGGSLWNCKCDCGKEIITKAHSLRCNQIKSCGCKNTINLLGQKFGKLTVIEFKGSNKYQGSTWLCECDCNKIIVINGSSLRSGSSTSCGCSRRNIFTIGEKRNDLTLIKIHDTDKHGNVRWLCQCKCGEFSVVTSHSLNKLKINGCKKCAIKGRTGKNSSNFSGYKEITGTFWGNLKQSAETRDFKFHITKEQIWDLFLKQDRKCALTGLILTLNDRAASSSGTASIDRIDSSKDYTEDNIQWVHKDINKMKNNFPQNLFIQYCKLVTNNLHIHKPTPIGMD